MNTILISQNGIDVRKDENNLVCLNDLWYAAGKPASKQPKYWKRLSSVKELIAHHLKLSEVRKSHPQLLYSTSGGGAATFAVRELALAYAGYLDVQLQSLIYQAFLDRVDGVSSEVEAPKAMERAFAGSSYRRKGKELSAAVRGDGEASYWRGYAEALEKMCLQLAERRFAV